MTEGMSHIRAELERAQRLLASLNNPQDRSEIERYIAELARMNELPPKAGLAVG
ncbi:hypothetical protein [Sphingobium lignivorans]|uniref:Uncharacterized protein YjcR n=1 Tax=Sphingobium lignivorans TaxID=2735886 RepID=A0ABR6NC51_9SPHN|nr:hypothetical protein [Sphingobium lignivorans]MBB5984856.1 uncharacterized protein YjcR [Sphingobium lignivorans]